GSTIEFSGGSSPRIARDVTDLPLPDSPTSATVRLRGISNETPLTASNMVPLSIWKATLRLRTRTSGSVFEACIASVILGPQPSLEPRIERVTQRVGEEAERGHECGHRGGGGDELPPFAEDQLVLRLVQHRSPRHDVDRNAESEERQD